MWLRIKKIMWFVSKQSKSQMHLGEGDNVAGNKIVNLNITPPNVDDYINYHLKSIKPDRSFNKDVLAISFEEKTTYPKLNFSITNRSDYPIQITGISCIKAACIKNKEKGEFDYLMGPRLKIEVDVEKIGSGFRQRIFGDETISNLNAYENEAFQLVLETKNTSNLLELEIEYSSPILSGNLVYVSKNIIFAGTSFSHEESINKSIDIISRKDAVSSLLDNDNLNSLPLFPNAILMRGAAYIFRFESTNNVLKLFDKYEDNLDFGSILASYSEFIVNNKVDDRIIKYLYDWIWSPTKIAKTIGTDIESYQTTIFKNLISGYSPQKKLIFSIQTLDKLIEVPSKINDNQRIEGISEDPAMIEILKQASLSTLRKQILSTINIDGDEKIYPVILSFLNVHETPSMINDFMEQITGKESGINFGRDEDTIEYWNSWHQSFKELSTDYLQFSKRLSAIYSIVYKEPSKKELLDLSNNPDDALRFALSRRKNLPLEILENLSKDNNDTIRYEMTRKATTPTSILDVLSNDNNSIIRRWVAAHQNIDSKIILRLSVDKRVEVRSFLIRNPKLDFDLLKEIENREVDATLRKEISEIINSAQNNR